MDTYMIDVPIVYKAQAHFFTELRRLISAEFLRESEYQKYRVR